MTSIDYRTVILLKILITFNYTALVYASHVYSDIVKVFDLTVFI